MAPLQNRTANTRQLLLSCSTNPIKRDPSRFFLCPSPALTMEQPRLKHGSDGLRRVTPSDPRVRGTASSALEHTASYMKSGRWSAALALIAVVGYSVFAYTRTPPRATCYAPTVYLYILLVGTFLMFGEIGLNNINRQQAVYDSQFSHVSDSKQCPQLVGYLTRFQSLFSTYPFALAAAGSVGLIVMVVLYILEVCRRPSGARHLSFASPNHMTILLGSLVSCLLTFAWTYKVLNCILGRMCGQTFCAAHAL